MGRPKQNCQLGSRACPRAILRRRGSLEVGWCKSGAMETNLASAFETKNIPTKKNIYFVQTHSPGVHFVMFNVIIPFHFTEGKLRLGAHRCPGCTAPEHRAEQGAFRTCGYHTVLCRAGLELPVAVRVNKSREHTEDARAKEGSIKTSKTSSDWDPQGIEVRGVWGELCHGIKEVNCPHTIQVQATEA